MKPTLATLIKEPFDSKDWIFEVKFDGYRALAHKNGKIKLLSRNGQSFNDRFPQIVKELEQLSAKCILDGEIVILDSKGRSHFQLLQNYQRNKIGTPYYYLFDILSYNNQDLRQLPLTERREILQKLLKKHKFTHLRYSASIETKGIAFFKKATKKGLEGIIAKRKLSLYPSRRTKDWLKIKAQKGQEVVIGGFTAPKGSRKRFGALLIGVYKKGKLQYAGRVGGGFNGQLLEEVYSQMKKLITPKPPFENPPKTNDSTTWIKPKLVCEVSFTEWTTAGSLRHPIFKGMRTDKSAKKVVKE